MEEKRNVIDFEEDMDSEINDIWDLVFPYMVEKQEKMKKIDEEKTKPRRYMRFLTM